MTRAPAPPLLVVEDIRYNRDNEDILSAQIRLAGHPLEVILDFTRVSSGLVKYVQMPWMLGLHHPSQKAIVRLMTQFHAGKPLQFPADLGDELAAANPSSPFQLDPVEDARLQRESASISVDLAQMRRSGIYPALFTGVVRIGGQPLDLEAELYAGIGRVPVVRWVRTSRTLTPAESDAVERRLIGELETARRDTLT